MHLTPQPVSSTAITAVGIPINVVETTVNAWIGEMFHKLKLTSESAKKLTERICQRINNFEKLLKQKCGIGICHCETIRILCQMVTTSYRSIDKVPCTPEFKNLAHNLGNYRHEALGNGKLCEYLHEAKII